ncbi:MULTISPECIES: homoserine dehydrogenase [Cyanobium]|uniref:Homoserine dehydrogenase n=1 Tax=Cyanobium usitatum str. Tous TaxID=2116684 RepID=A0A2P7N1D4_9CYAN|nr:MULTISPECIES: homoserine dehydrogenase [Cyanobium]MCP9779162.1 homoserine dehydrogenase [Cyanobium sp. To12R1]PSJ07287.1 homoserine dehydrogenase [Cyanobium usitatum str. Tous]
MTIGIGLLGLGTVGAGVAAILATPAGRHPLVGELELRRVAVRDLNRPRPVELAAELLSTDPEAVVDDLAVEIVVEVMGGLEPARSLILRAIAAGKPVVTANKAVIARYGEEIAAAAARSGVYVLIEAAVGGGIPIIEPLKQSLGANRIQRVSGIINGTTNYILSRMAAEGAAYPDVLADAQRLGYAEADPAADVQGGDAADKIAILAGLAYGGPVPREAIPTEGIDQLDARDIAYAEQLGYVVKLLAVAQAMPSEQAMPGEQAEQLLDVRVHPTLLPKAHPLAGVNGVNNAILVEGDPVGQVMFYGPGAGAGPTASAVVADILNIAGIRQATGGRGTQAPLDPLLAAGSWRDCQLVESAVTSHRNYLRLRTSDRAGVIGAIGTCFGEAGVSIQSIVQFETQSAGGAEIVVITHEVCEANFRQALAAIEALTDVQAVAACLRTL